MSMPLPSGLRPLALSAVLVLSACGGGKGASQTAAKVNKEEITVHQINFVLSRQPNLRPEQTDAAGRQVLERLIEQELAVQRAEEMKLDRDPRVMQQIEVAKREILARSLAERIGESVAKPTADEVTRHYESNPALFKERRIYNLQELAIELRPEQFDGIKARLVAAKTLPDFVEYLKSAGLRFVGNQAVRSAEQLAPANLAAVAQLKDGQSMIQQNSNGLQVVVLAGSRSAPIAFEQARPAIETYLLNQRRLEQVNKEMKALRSAAKIEYVGKFAVAAGAAPADPSAAGASAAAAALVAASAASGLDAGDISKGMGLK